MYERLPHFVFLKNEKYLINTDFRIFINFEEKMQDEGDKKVIIDTLQSFYPAFLEIMNKNLVQEAIEKFLWFYACGKISQDNTKKNKGSNERQFSYNHDKLLIWGTYKMYFDIDLTKIKMHWWKFKALWQVIPENAEFNKIKGYRSYKGKDKDILSLKEYYQLPPTKYELKEQIRRDKIYEMLK